MSSLFKLPASYKEFINDFNPSNMDVTFRGFQSIESSIENDGVTLGQLEESYGLKDALEYIKSWLKSINSLLNINKPLDDNQIAVVSFKIFEKFSHLYLTDLKLIGDKILLGDGVRFYGSVDTQAILMAFNDYSRERKLKINEKSNEGTKHITEPTKSLRNYNSEDLSQILGRLTDGNVKGIVERMKKNRLKQEKNAPKQE